MKINIDFSSEEMIGFIYYKYKYQLNNETELQHLTQSLIYNTLRVIRGEYVSGSFYRGNLELNMDEDIIMKYTPLIMHLMQAIPYDTTDVREEIMKLLSVFKGTRMNPPFRIIFLPESLDEFYREQYEDDEDYY